MSSPRSAKVLSENRGNSDSHPCVWQLHLQCSVFVPFMFVFLPGLTACGTVFENTLFKISGVYANSWDLWYTWYVVKTWDRRLQRLAPSRSTFWQTSVFNLSKLVFVVRTWAWTWDKRDKNISQLKIRTQYYVSHGVKLWTHKMWSWLLCKCQQKCHAGYLIQWHWSIEQHWMVCSAL